MSENKELNKDQKKDSQELSANAQLLKVLSSRITFALGALIGVGISWLLGHPIAVGVLFGGAAALTLTTMFAPNKAKKERWVLGFAMLVFLILSILAYAIY